MYFTPCLRLKLERQGISSVTLNLRDISTLLVDVVLIDIDKIQEFFYTKVNMLSDMLYNAFFGSVMHVQDH